MRRSARTPLLLAAAALVLAAEPTRAQNDGVTRLSYAGPGVTVVSRADGETAARLDVPVLPGDVLVTGAAARAEAVLADGNVLRLDGESEIRLEQIARTAGFDDDRTVLALARGSAAVEVREVSTRGRALRLDTDDATVLSPARSLFRVDAGARGTEVCVLAGSVEVNGRGGRALVRAGEVAHVAGDEDIEVEAAGEPRDRFAGFVDERRDALDRDALSGDSASDVSTAPDAAPPEGPYAFPTVIVPIIGGWSATRTHGPAEPLDGGWRGRPSLAPVPVDRSANRHRDPHGDSGWHAPAPRAVERSNPVPASPHGPPVTHDAAPRPAPATAGPASGASRREH